ncbi:MAG TPA: MFS transporter [Trebonia sp.]|nr:MFS transporter [Trebonia sp.]
MTEAPAARRPRVGTPGLVLLASATASRLADSAASVALVLLILARTHDARLSGLVVGAFTVPTLVSGPVLGAYLDRLRHRKPLFAANSVTLAAALIGVDALAGRAPGWVLAVFGLCAGLTAPVLTGGFSSLVPLVVPPGALARANALDSASYNVGGLAGPALVAAIASTAGPAPALASVAAVALAGLVLVMAAPMPPAPGGAVRHESLLAALADGLRLLRRSARLASVSVATTVAQFFQGFLPVICPLLALALREPESGGGWLLTALSAGGLAGALASERLLTWRSARWVLVVSLASMGVFLVLMAVTPVFWACVVFAVAAGLAEGPSLTATLDVRQRETPPGRYAQVTATAASLKTGAYALGAAAVGLASGALTARELMALAAAGQLLAACPLLVYWRPATTTKRSMVPS